MDPYEAKLSELEHARRKDDAKIFLERLKEVEKIVPGQTKEGPSILREQEEMPNVREEWLLWLTKNKK